MIPLIPDQVKGNTWAAIAAAAASGVVVFEHEVSFALLPSPFNSDFLQHKAYLAIKTQLCNKYMFKTPEYCHSSQEFPVH